MKVTHHLILAVVLGLFFSPPALAEELRILAWEGYAPQAQTQAFARRIKQSFDIELEIKVAHVSSVEDFFEALRQKTADLISPAHNLLKDPRFKMISGKLTTPVNLANIPLYQDILPKLQRAGYCAENGEIFGVPLTYGPYGLAYNTQQVQVAPVSWNILWDPQYAGKYAVSSDYYEANIYITALASGVSKQDLGNFDRVHQPEFSQKLKYLAKNAKSLWVGVDSADVLQGLSLATAWGFSLPELKQRGEQWRMASPREGVTGWVDNWVLSHTLRSNPRLKQIAEEWINYCLSPEFQVEVVIRSLGSYPVNARLQDRVTAEERQTYHLDDPQYFESQLILWEVLDPRSRKGFQLLWEKALAD